MGSGPVPAVACVPRGYPSYNAFVNETVARQLVGTETLRTRHSFSSRGIEGGAAE